MARRLSSIWLEDGTEIRIELFCRQADVLDVRTEVEALAVYPHTSNRVLIGKRK